jgi:maltose/moltooligosaccharide transporter
MAVSSSIPSARKGIDKPTLGFWQIWNMNFGFLGIQFGFALQNANVSRIFETLGANIDEIAILWIAAPTTGLFVQPLIGHLSDKTWSPRWGRRRPFFTLGAILASIALLIMPHSSALWMAAGMLWILDASINVSMEPFRALIGDMMPESQRTIGFAMQTFFIGLGAIIASALPYLLSNVFGFSSEAKAGEIPATVIWSFYLGAIVFFGAVMWTVFNTKEYPPEELAKYNGDTKTQEHNEGFMEIFKDFMRMPKTMMQLAVVQFFSWLALFAMWIYTTQGVTSHIFDMKIEKAQFTVLDTEIRKISPTGEAKAKEEHERVIKQLDIVKAKYEAGKMPALTLGVVDYALGDKLVDEKALLQDFVNLSKVEKISNNKVSEELKILQERLTKDPKEKISLSYEACKYFVDESVNVGKKMNWDENKKQKFAVITELKSVKKEYNAGGDWVGIMFAVYNGFSAVFAFLFPPFARATSRKTAHFVGLLCGSIGLASIYFMPNKDYLLISMIGVGFAWASILSMPYAILAGSLPANKMGVYMGIFNFFIVIPQIVAASILGFVLTNFFGSEPIYAMLIGGTSMLIAALLVFIVDDKGERVYL